MVLKIINKKQELENVTGLIFEKPQGFTFYPGQYLDIELPVKDPLGNTRAFTISSSPTEKFLMVTFKKGISIFKKKFETLKPGDMVQASHPAGTFILDEKSPAVFLAGGVGITPFRSILKYVSDQTISTPIILIYSNSGENFLFKEELEGWKQELSNLDIIYHNSSQSGRLEKLSTINHKPSTLYYLAGSHSFVNDMAQMLINSGVDETNIRYDRFDGYP